MKYFIDTNIIIYSIKGVNKNIEMHFKNISAQSICIPSVVVGEIEYGARKSFDYDKTILTYNKFVDCFDVIDYDRKASLKYGKIRSELEKNGCIIGNNDMMIASIVLANDGILVTHNTKEFERIEDLRIEDWTE